MASILSQLLKKQADIKEQIAANSLPLDELLVMQELNYRIGVLETFQALVKTAPLSTDTSVLKQHYGIFDVSLRYLLKDHKFGIATDDNGKKRRETAEKAVMDVISANQKKFTSFVAETQDQYKRYISECANTVLPMWLQFRETYITINLQEA